LFLFGSQCEFGAAQGNVPHVDIEANACCKTLKAAQPGHLAANAIDANAV
jgi:hypothetical protein